MKAVAVILFLLGAIPAGAQLTIKGVVADSITHQPLSFATIRAGQSSAVAAIDGRFVLSIKTDGNVVFRTAATALKPLPHRL